MAWSSEVAAGWLYHVVVVHPSQGSTSLYQLEEPFYESEEEAIRAAHEALLAMPKDSSALIYVAKKAILKE